MMLRKTPLLNKKEIKEELKKLKVGTKEWVRKGGELNLLNGCFNDCAYCYARNMAHRMKRIPYEEWGNVCEINLKNLHIPSSIRKHNPTKYDFMCPTTSDIFPNKKDLLIYDTYLDVYKKILSKGFTLLITSKPRIEVIKNLCEDLKEYRDLITFRFTITSINNKTLSLLERNAPNFEERIKSLKHAYLKGFNTSISIEPLLDPDPRPIISKVTPYLSITNIDKDIGTIWVGLFKTKYTPHFYRKKHNLEKIYSEIKNSQTFEKVYSWYSALYFHPNIRMKESVNKLMIKNNIKLKKN